MIPPFDKRGNLRHRKTPYQTTWDELVNRFGYNDHRLRLLEGMKRALDHLKEVGCRQVYIDGSFVTSKEIPGDWDGCWDIDGVDFERLDPVILAEEFHHDERKKKYLGDPFLHAPRLPGGQWVGRFQKDRDGNDKGILVINVETL